MSRRFELIKPDVLAVAKLHPLYLQALQMAYTVHERTHETDPAAFAQLASRIVGVAATGESMVAGTLLAKLPNAKVVSVFGVGYDGVDVQAANAHGIAVTHTPDVLTDLVLSIGRRIPQADRFVRAGEWLNGPIGLAQKVSGTRLGIVGLGRIGQAIARRAIGFDMSIAYTARSSKPDCGYQFYPTAQALAAQVDYMVVITPGGAGTRHLINADVLSALGAKAYLINVARGSVVDEVALIQALKTGTIAGAALDVYANEPRVPEALRSLPNVVLTPHMASATLQTRQAMADLAFANMQAGTSRKTLLSPVPECTLGA
jgi:hydroxypyruvate reductase